MIERKERVEGGRGRQCSAIQPIDALATKLGCEPLEPALVKSRQTAVGTYRMGTAPA
ncbi:MAG: hypothetical protein QOE18_237 [Chloroflexota bacterium]|jgi:hypothetical protein|nr:hypothetical protein [Chloroflexota bacterium]